VSKPLQDDRQQERFAGDRYHRLRQGAEVLALDPAVIDASFPFNSDGLHHFATAVIKRQLLDHLSEPNADMVTMLLLLDYYRGPAQVIARIQDLLSKCARPTRREYDTLSVVSGLATALALMTNTETWVPAPTYKVTN
jgi:hypothetical protein